MAIFKCVCDRCKKKATSFLKMQTERVGSRIRIKGSYLLCDECAKDFTDRFINGYGHEENIVRSYYKGGDNDA